MGVTLEKQQHGMVPGDGRHEEDYPTCFLLDFFIFFYFFSCLISFWSVSVNIINLTQRQLVLK